MPSQTLLLAVSIPLAVLLFLVLASFVFFVFRTRAQQRDTDNDYSETIDRLRKRIEDTPPKVRDVFYLATDGIPPDDVQRAFFDLKATLYYLKMKWIKNLGSMSESEERIKQVLFQNIGPIDGYAAPDDCRLFSNPHNYTALEISTAILSGDGQRPDMLEHIILATILPGVMLNLNGNPSTCLLPFPRRDLTSIATLFEIIRGHYCKYELIHLPECLC